VLLGPIAPSRGHNSTSRRPFQRAPRATVPPSTRGRLTKGRRFLCADGFSARSLKRLLSRVAPTFGRLWNATEHRLARPIVGAAKPCEANTLGLSCCAHGHSPIACPQMGRLLGGRVSVPPAVRRAYQRRALRIRFRQFQTTVIAVEPSNGPATTAIRSSGPFSGSFTTLSPPY
jgi:hypothetical protein